MAGRTREANSRNTCHCHVHKVARHIPLAIRVVESCFHPSVALITQMVATQWICFYPVVDLDLPSGSTGTPKGVVLTHGNMAFTLGAFLYNLDPLPDDMYIAYLPLAHVLELLGELQYDSKYALCPMINALANNLI